MNKIILVSLISFLLFSCGDGTKKEETIDEKVIVADQFSVTINALYPKDDVISIVFKKDGYYLSGEPVEKIVKGSDLPQQITIDLPKGEKIQNLSINLSTNKEQNEIGITGISIKNNDKVVLSDKENFTTYFMANDKVTWNESTSKYVMKHGGEYPPAMGGSEQLEALLDN
ncbi:hypothetical protein [uncultured Flavobacterium sp.]|uniref:hypothetical protein n=1 Tax=uncultured Flavobacterium sp. TaxID=165435 RepID=UPI0030ED5A01|tara:strand:+ start:1614 stop:2126 length:513 start_codon:yes stop_codon:yes gene_type:complete